MPPRGFNRPTYGSATIRISLVKYVLDELLLSWWLPSYDFRLHGAANFLLGHTFSSVNFTSWLSAVGRRPSLADMGDRPDGSCPQNPPLDMNKRTKFGRLGCTAYGYPLSGGVLIKEVDVVDMQFFSLIASARRNAQRTYFKRTSFALACAR